MSTNDTTSNSDELARLLPALSKDMKVTAAVSGVLTRGPRGAVRRVARACELLLAERAARLSHIHPDPEIASEILAELKEGRALDRAAGVREAWHKGPVAREDLEAYEALAIEHEGLPVGQALAHLLAERADATARPLAALRAAGFEVASADLEAERTEARRAAAMWEARYREVEELREQDAAVLRALRAEVERLRAPAPAGGADREAELDRIEAAQRERMGASSTESDAVSAGYVASIRITRDAPAADLDAARAAAREARERADKATEGPWRAGAFETWNVYVPYANSLEGPNGERVILRMNQHFPNKADAAFIAAARTDVPALAAHVEALADETERLRARVAELEALKPAGWRVAALLAAVPTRLRDEAQKLRSESSGDYSRGIIDTKEIVADELAASIGTTSPLDRVVAEVVALGQRYNPDSECAPGDYLRTIVDLANGGDIDGLKDRAMFRMIAAVSLAGLQACDAPAPAHPWNWCPRCSAPVDTPDESFDGSEVRCIGCRTVYVIVTDGEASELQSREEHDREDAPDPEAPCPSALMHSTLGRLPCNVRGPHAEHVSATVERWGSEGVAEHPSFDTRAFFDDGAAKKGDE